MTAQLNRRQFLASVPALIATTRVLAQTPNPAIRLRGFNHIALVISDPKRSIDFYQGLFGLSVLSRGDDGARLQVGAGSPYLGMSNSNRNRTPRIDHFCLSVEDFNATRILGTLAARGVTKALAAPDVPEVSIGDPDDILFQVTDANFSRAQAPQPSPTKGLISVKSFSHVTLFSTDVTRSNAFYRDLFGMKVRSYQGPNAPTLAVGAGVEFLMWAPAGPSRQAGVNHFCVTVDQFNSDRILKTLESYGIKPRENQAGPVAPMRHYVSMRMENRGGAKEGTPELYFTDPDGILVQLQDVSYCGGAGLLGNVCL